MVGRNTKNLGSLVATSNWNSCVSGNREPELVLVDDQPASLASSINLVGCVPQLSCRFCTSDSRVTNPLEFNSTTTQRFVRLDSLRKAPSKICECRKATKAERSHPGLSPPCLLAYRHSTLDNLSVTGRLWASYYRGRHHLRADAKELHVAGASVSPNCLLSSTNHTGTVVA